MATMPAPRTTWTSCKGGVCEYRQDGGHPHLSSSWPCSTPSPSILVLIALKFPPNLKQGRLQSDTQKDFPTIILGPLPRVGDSNQHYHALPLALSL